MLPKLACHELNQRYEVDELRTFCGNKKNELWVMYIINRSSRKLVAFAVGRRTKANIAQLLATIEQQEPARIYSDKLGIYEQLIADSIHRTHTRCTNRIERKNLTLRTHLKRLARKTLCFTKSAHMLHSCLQLYVAYTNTTHGEAAM